MPGRCHSRDRGQGIGFPTLPDAGKREPIPGIGSKPRYVVLSRYLDTRAGRLSPALVLAQPRQGEGEETVVNRTSRSGLRRFALDRRDDALAKWQRLVEFSECEMSEGEVHHRKSSIGGASDLLRQFKAAARQRNPAAGVSAVEVDHGSDPVGPHLHFARIRGHDDRHGFFQTSLGLGQASHIGEEFATHMQGPNVRIGSRRKVALRIRRRGA